MNHIPFYAILCRFVSSRLTPYALRLTILFLLTLTASAPCHAAGDVMSDLTYLSGLGDRSTGSAGCDQAAQYILQSFREVGLTNVDVQKFLLPIPEVENAAIEVAGNTLPLYPWGPNMVYLSMTPEEGLKGPLVYVRNGALEHFNGRSVDGSIVLMDQESGGNWLNAAMLGARALIFLGNKQSIRKEFKDKDISTPLAFPRFWVTAEDGEKLRQLAEQSRPEAVVRSKTGWQNKTVQNCYGFIEGKSEKLKNELVVLQAFYDASSHLLGLAPGTDEAVSISMLLHLARTLAQERPDRSILFMATVGNAQGLAGMREFIWAVQNRRKWMKDEERSLKKRKKEIDHQLELVRAEDPLSLEDPGDRQLIWNIIDRKARDMADQLTREIQYQKALERNAPGEKEKRTESKKDQNPSLPREPRPYRRLSWSSGLSELTPEEKVLGLTLLKEAESGLKADKKELKQREDALRSSLRLRSNMADYTPVLYLSLNLTSRSPYCGLVEWGKTFPLRERIVSKIRTFRLGEILGKVSGEVARETGLTNIIRSPSQLSGGRSASATPIATLASDVAAMADLPAVSLATLDDDRDLWSTPNDTPDRLNTAQVQVLSRFLPPLIQKLSSDERLEGACEVAGFSGMASIEGQAKFIRQGELFPDQPAPGTIISVIQGDTVFKTMVYRDGTFYLPILPNRRVSLQKFILEPYGTDPETGRVAWTADKNETGKSNYRIKVKSKLASTALVMFHCEQTDVAGAFHPRKMDHLTKVELLDAITDTKPLRYWYSRMDGRDTMAISVFLEPGTRFKLILSQTLLHKEFFLLGSSPESVEGKGFLIGDPPEILRAPFQVTHDLHFLMQKRLSNLRSHGIINRYLETLYETSSQDLKDAEQGLILQKYDRFWGHTVSAWGKLNVIYAEVESTQRDVLTGVMFFIALFVPFAYCLERYLFCFRNIYQQLVAFFVILLMTIFTIRALHPAFQLTYSPMVVIIAFFIVGLSVFVSWIIFVRFEREMEDLQHRSLHAKARQVGKWQALGAGFTIGVSNMNRRKLRTALTCTTLVILTFTVMSFTNVKTVRQTTDTRISNEAPYRGVLIRDPFWRSLTPLLLGKLEAGKLPSLKPPSLPASETVLSSASYALWPRAWILPVNASNRTVAKLYSPASDETESSPFEAGTLPYKTLSLEGVLGLGYRTPAYVRDIVKYGRWFQPGRRNEILLPVEPSKSLGLDPAKDLNVSVQIGGNSFQVVGYFDGGLLETMKDLDQNPITPAYMEADQNEELSEAEVEAAQEGEEVLPRTERFRYASANATVIVPYESCVALGGELKAISLLPLGEESPMKVAERLSSWLAYPLFVGENGIRYHSAGSAIRYQGVTNLIVPILIVIFICLNTMVGHVHERRKEIGTYTSVGLAPTHVGFLFIVEALSLAVLSTVVGYIIAQLSAKYLGGTALFAELTFNYSSLAGIACMFLVFSVVFLASLYPARMAAEIAMPDVNRTWTLPEPEGDMVTLNLPFLLKYDEEEGIMGFLTAFFKSHRDITHGRFTVDETSLNLETPVINTYQTPDPVCLLIRSNVWLAPFDFGIKQRLHLHCCPSDENPGYLEIAIQMIRVSGERSAWMRANKGFIRAMRKQILLWRLLDQEDKLGYCEVVSEERKETSEPSSV